MYSDRLNTRNVIVVCVTVLLALTLGAWAFVVTSHNDSIDRRHRIDACHDLDSETARAVCVVTVP